MYYLVFDEKSTRNQFIDFLKSKEIFSVFHYIPLHSSPEGVKSSRTQGSLPVTEFIADRIVRLPFWIGIEKYQANIIENINYFFRKFK